MKYNKLHINFDKSCFIYFGTFGQQSLYNEKKLPPIIYMIVDKEIKPVSEIKFLGVIIDEKLFWDAHIKLLSENHYFFNSNYLYVCFPLCRKFSGMLNLYILFWIEKLCFICKQENLNSLNSCIYYLSKIWNCKFIHSPRDLNLM